MGDKTTDTALTAEVNSAAPCVQASRPPLPKHGQQRVLTGEVETQTGLSWPPALFLLGMPVRPHCIEVRLSLIEHASRLTLSGSETKSLV